MNEEKDDAPQRAIHPARRRFVGGTAAALGTLALGNSGSAIAAPSLEYSPAAFEADPNTALIWMCGADPLRAAVEFGADEALGQPRRGPAVELNRANDFTAALQLDGLTPGQAWYYRIIDAAANKPVSPIGRFKTAPATAQPFTFAWSGDMDEAYKPFRLFDVIAARDPDFFLHLGDTVYADLPRKQFSPSVSHYRGKHAAVRKDSHLQRFMLRHTTYAIWDDHETDNGCDGAHPNMAQALQVFREYWPCRPASAEGLYRRIGWAGVDFIILDTRRFRSPQAAADGPDKTMLGSAQKQWFLDALKSSTAPFKFIATSVPFHGGGDDTWGNYKTERDEITRFIREQKIKGVVFLTADYHLARDWTNAKTRVREYMAGPIASFVQYQRTPAMRDRYEKAGTFHYGDGYNFGMFRVDPAAERATLEFVDAGGKTLFTTELSP
jgi:alkaline phosphatase D